MTARLKVGQIWRSPEEGGRFIRILCADRELIRVAFSGGTSPPTVMRFRSLDMMGCTLLVDPIYSQEFDPSKRARW